MQHAGRTYTPLEGPPKNIAGPQPELRMQTRGSKFVRFQEMKLQERAIEVGGDTLINNPSLSSDGCHIRSFT